MSSQNKYDLKNILRKILAAFFLVSVAIILALTLNRFSFREMMGTVDKLSEPNGKLTILNSLFEQITTLDQLQRAEAIKNPKKPYHSFLEESVSINTLIDSLQSFPWDSTQHERLGKMHGILNERNELFFRYLKVKAELLDNKDFAVQLDTLAAILKDDDFTIDSTLVKQNKKTTTTFVRDTVAKAKKPEQRSLLKKIFSKKKNAIAAIDTPKIKIEQETSLIVDTAAITRQNQAVKEIEKIMREMEIDQRVQRKKLQQQELELIHSNSQFVNQLLSILHDVEKEELQQMQSDNHHAVTVMNQSISRTNILMFSFFIAAAILVYLIWIDIGRSNYYKEQLEKARDEAEQLSQIKQRFLANMSHEIRTPLQSIIGFAEQLKQKNDHSKSEAEAIYSSSEYLLQIVNEVLDYSRISSGTLTLTSEPFNLEELIKEVEAAMRIQATQKNLLFTVDLQQAFIPIILGDAFRLRQILYNVIGNAIKFTHRGSVQLVLKTKIEGSRINCTFEVIDTGIGIAREDLDKIFNQFEQANPSVAKSYGGTGLGLSIVKALVTAQNGNIQVTSEPARGTTFCIQLAFDKAPASAIRHVTPETLTTLQFKGKVMVVDDDGLILSLCDLILKKNKINHITFNTAFKALQHPVDPAITHILLDIRMPGMSGVELCRALKHQYPNTVRFIALTAHVLSDEKANLLKEGFDDVLAKPFHEGEILQALGTVPSIEENPTDAEEPDFTTLRQMTMNDDALFQSILSQFTDETKSDLDHIGKLMEYHDHRALREVIHKMAGRFAQIGLKGVAAKLHTLEKRLVAGDSTSMLEGEVSFTVTKVKGSLDQLKKSVVEELNHPR